MKSVFEKLKERLEEESQYSCSHCMERAISIVSEVEAEYGNWKTNADRIRTMSDEELAEFFNQHDCVCDFCTFNMGCLQHETVRCKEGFLNWLKSPTTD